MGRQAAARRVTADLDAVDDASCTVLHVDMDAFFAAVELRRHPELAGRPMMVAHTGGRGVVLSATYEARAFGVRSAMPTARALAQCPGIAVVEPDHTAYREASHRIMSLLGEVTPAVEVVSVDEAFLDVAGAVRRLGRPARIGERIRRAVEDRLGLTATVGVAPNKFLAKLASSLAKPDGLLVVPPGDVDAFLRPLPVGALWGVGPRTAERLQSCGFATVADIAGASVPRLASIVGAAAARSLTALAHGRDDRPVTPVTADITIGTERTFERDVTDDAVIRRTLLGLSASAARRMRAAGHSTRTIVLKVRFDDFTTVTRSDSVPTPVIGDREIHAATMRNWARVDRSRRAVRLLGVRLDNLADAAAAQEQLELAVDGPRPEWRAAQQVVDELTERFGSAAPRAAALVDRPEAAPRHSPRGAPTSRRLA